MNKDEHILRILTKLKHKKYEYFVVSRIIQQIFDSDIKFVCQQLVRRPDGRGRALLDMYFPQLNISLEIDEPQHENKENKLSDKQRTRDIINVAQLDEKRIQILSENGQLKSLTRIAKDTDSFLEYLQEKAAHVRADGEWVPWDFDNELTAKPHLARGYIDAADDVLLRRHIDAIELFGRKLKGHQGGGWVPPKSYNLTMIWFPRLYKNDKWDNSLSDDGTQIIEKNLDDRGLSIMNQDQYGPNHHRAVFARRDEPLIGTLYRFVGVFEYSKAASRDLGAAVYDKISNRINLEPSKTT